MIHPYLYYAVPHETYVADLEDARAHTAVPTTSVSDTAADGTVRVAVRPGDRVYFVVAHAHPDDVERMRAIIETSHTEREIRQYIGVTVYVYES